MFEGYGFILDEVGVVFLIVEILLSIAIIWALFDIVKNKNFNIGKKILLAILVIFLSYFGFLIYFVCFSRRAYARKEKEAAAREQFEYEAAQERSYPKKYESLEEFCDYLNTHESWEWQGELKSIIDWNDWEDRTSYENEICSKDGNYLIYSSYEGKYIIDRRW